MKMVRTGHAEGGGPQCDPRRAVPIHQQSIDQSEHHARHIDDAIQRAELRLGETELTVQQVGDRTDGIGFVVTAGDGQGGKRQHPPAAHRCRGRCRGRRWRGWRAHAAGNWVMRHRK
jgi:hypothetical protein